MRKSNFNLKIIKNKFINQVNGLVRKSLQTLLIEMTRSQIMEYTAIESLGKSRIRNV